MRLCDNTWGRSWHCQSARLTGSSESERWVKTNLTNYLHPANAPTGPSSGQLSFQLTLTLFLSLSCCVCDTTPCLLRHLGHGWPQRTPLHTCINKNTRSHVTLALYFCLPGRNGRSKLSIFMLLALQVNCLRDTAVMNIRFETRGGGKIGWEGDGEKKKKQGGEGKMLTLFSDPCHCASFFPLSLFLFYLHLFYSCFLHIYSLYWPLTILISPSHPYLFSFGSWWLRMCHAYPS